MIHILAVNQHTPVFTSPSGYTFTVAETAQTGLSIGNIAATDADGDQLVYRLENATKGKIARVYSCIYMGCFLGGTKTRPCTPERVRARPWLSDCLCMIIFVMHVCYVNTCKITNRKYVVVRNTN